ncbi:MAG: hypothetical protein ACE5FW_01320 [Candidatus Aenigmatarchaeota archaeon]
METPTARDHLLLMFGMKPERKWVDLNHCHEKLSRDWKKAPKEEVKKLLDKLVEEGFIWAKAGKYTRNPKCLAELERRLPKLDQKKLNFTYLLVYWARQYYPKVSDTVLEFCKDRMVGFYVVFTGKRFFRRNFRGRKITLNSLKDLMFYIDVHYVDVIPCVHRIGKEKPDWLVLDLDAGPKVSWKDIIRTTKTTYQIMDKLGLNPVLKFSGSKGFQIWSLLDCPLPGWYQPVPLPGATKRERNFFTLYSDLVRTIQKLVDKKVPGLTISVPVGKEQRKDKILLDWASMKPLGLVRAPFSMHSRTGLVSLPLAASELGSFKPGMATPERAVKEYQKRKKLFILRPGKPGKILEELKKLGS